MRRRWFFFIAVVLLGLGLWVLEARPSELVPNQGGRALAAEFFADALRPALDYQNSEIRETAPPFFGKVFSALWLTIRYALMAMGFALVLGMVGGVLGSRAWWSKPHPALVILRISVRLLATALRSVHELIWALLFLAAIGTSPVAAVMAMALPYGGTLAKVFSELLDEHEDSAAEVLRGIGGGGLISFLVGIGTKAFPDLASYGLYRFECAIRSSAVLGFVGIPTIGYEIKTAFEDGHYQEIWTYLYVLFAVVIFFEWWGSRIRQIFSRGVPAKTEKGMALRKLWKGRGLSYFLRGSALVFVIGLVLAWSGSDDWAPKISWERRMVNLERFLGDVVPHPVSEANGDWSLLMPWVSEQMEDGGKEAVVKTAFLGTVAVLICGGIALLGICYAARTLASSAPRGVGMQGFWWREVLGFALRTGAMAGRAMPEYILAFLLLGIFGPTVWALVIALAIHNGGILLRLGAEVIDNAKSQASVVLLAQGGGRWSAFLAALLPRSLNRFLLYLFYRWESCVREATILGMLGVASLGFLISDARSSFYYDQMVVWIVLGAGLVFLGDLTSDFVRSRIRKG